jgi:hypothetical protein
VSKDSDLTETAPNGEQAPMVYPGKDPRASDSVLAAAGMGHGALQRCGG